ncbi:MAG: helix-turn-helix transcriptional regulator, partial [Candidatus Thorarchaeota archaeon]
MQLPKGLTKKQFELLLLITPEIEGGGKSITQAAKELGISYNSAKNRLYTFKKNFPKEYQKWYKIREMSRHHRKILNCDYNNIKKKKR